MAAYVVALFGVGLLQRRRGRTRNSSSGVAQLNKKYFYFFNSSPTHPPFASYNHVLAKHSWPTGGLLHRSVNRPLVSHNTWRKAQQLMRIISEFRSYICSLTQKNQGSWFQVQIYRKQMKRTIEGMVTLHEVKVKMLFPFKWSYSPLPLIWAQLCSSSQIGSLLYGGAQRSEESIMNILEVTTGRRWFKCKNYRSARFIVT